jgi:hypothetical protein
VNAQDGSATVRLRNPDVGKSGARVCAEKYRVIRDAILTLTPREEPGLTFEQLAERVALHLESTPFSGSVRWYTKAVQLDLEAHGALRRVPGSRPLRFTLAT